MPVLNQAPSPTISPPAVPPLHSASPSAASLAVILTAKQRGLIPAAALLFDLIQQAGLFVIPTLRSQALALVGA